MDEFLSLFRDLYGTMNGWIEHYATGTYLILFLIVFVETGLIVMPLLPGDSLLFTAGMFCAVDDPTLKIQIVIPLLIGAALLGDNVNYLIGRTLSNQIRKRKRILFLKREYIDRTEAFYARHGGKTVILARFIPIVRTIAPFVAGAGNMKYRKYIVFCLVGATVWVGLIVFAGYRFGRFEWVKENFEKVVLGIVFVSVLPILIGLMRQWLTRKKEGVA